MSNIIAARDLRAGQTIIWNDEPHLILDNTFNKTAMRGGIVKCKIKNLNTGAITIEDFSNKKLTKALIDKCALIFSYADSENINMMHSETFEEIQLPIKEYEKEFHYLEEGMEIQAALYLGKVISITLPEIVTLSVVEVIEDNVSSEYKKAITKTGLVVLVPKFFKSTDSLSVSTEDGKDKSR